MKNLKTYLIFILSTTLTLSSCSSFLDKNPENQLPETSIDYSDLSNMFQPVAGAFAKMNGTLGSWPNCGYINVRGGDVDKGSTPGDQGALQSAKDFNYSQITSDWAFGVTWSNLYSIVQSCNASIDALNKYAVYATSDADKKANIQDQAEVRFLRAYAYFMITRMWGDAPLFTDNLSNDALVKAKRLDIYSFVDTELDTCVANLPLLRPNEMPYQGEVTAYSALALKAKAAADLSKWDVVLSATDKIINDGRFSLFPDYYQFFKKPGCLSNASLFELQYTDGGSNGGTSSLSDNWFVYQGPRAGFICSDTSKTLSTGWGFMAPSTNLVNFLTARGETVRAKTILLYTSSRTLDGDSVLPAAPGTPLIYDGKMYFPSNQMAEGVTSYGAGNNIRVLRYADVLLLNAEAKINLGQNGDAPLNLVRARANMPALTGASIDQVLDERRVEFACEWGERFFDLVRTGKATSTLPGFVTGQNEFYPIPQNQIDLNPDLAN